MKRLLLILALCAIPVGCKAADSATPSEQQEITALEEERDAALAAGDQAAADAAAAELGRLEGNIAERAVGWVFDLVQPFVPIPLAPFKKEIVGFGVLLAFKRSRRHMIAGLKAIAKADPKEVGLSILRTFGLKHSNEDPRSVILAGIKLAKKNGDAELVAAMEAGLAKLDAATAEALAAAAIAAGGD